MLEDASRAVERHHLGAKRDRLGIRIELGQVDDLFESADGGVDRLVDVGDVRAMQAEPSTAELHAICGQ